MAWEYFLSRKSKSTGLTSRRRSLWNEAVPLGETVRRPALPLFYSEVIIESEEVDSSCFFFENIFI